MGCGKVPVGVQGIVNTMCRGTCSFSATAAYIQKLQRAHAAWAEVTKPECSAAEYTTSSGLKKTDHGCGHSRLDWQ